MLSAGVALANYRPLVLDYLSNQENVQQVHSHNIDSSGQFIFTDLFTTDVEKNFRSEFVNNHPHYYERVKNLATDPNGLFYLDSSDPFLTENIELLLQAGVRFDQIKLDSVLPFAEQGLGL